MRVLFSNRSARCFLGGANRVVVETCNWLHASGHTVALAFDDGGAHEVECPVYRLPSPLDAAARWAALHRVIGEFRPDLVSLHVSDAMEVCAPLLQSVPAALFVHDQSLWCSSGDRMTRGFVSCHRAHGVGCLFHNYWSGCGGKNPLGNWRRWRRVERVYPVVAAERLRFQVASGFMRQSLEENGCPRERIDIVPLYAERPLALSTTEPGMIVCPSRLVRGKGVQVLIDALGLLRDLSWQLVIAGDGPQRSALELQAARLGLTSRIRFIGEIKPAELDGWYTRCALVAFPVLRPEPFGLVGIEALAAQKPIVAFTGGAVGEWLQPEETGIAVEERTPTAFAAALRRLLQDPSLLQRMSEATCRHWPQYAREEYLKRLIQSYTRTIDRWHGR